MMYKEIFAQINLKEEKFLKFLEDYSVTKKLEELDERELFYLLGEYFKDVRKKLLDFQEKLKKEKSEIERLKKEWQKEENKRLEELELKLKQIEQDFNKQLEKRKIEFEASLLNEKEEFLKNAREEFEKFINKKYQEFAKKEQELTEKELEITQKYNLLEQKEKTFESLKEKELNNLKEKIAEQEIEFQHSLKEKEAKLLEEAHTKIKKLYSLKEEELKEKENKLNELEVSLKKEKQILSIKEKELEEEKKLISKKVDELLDEKIKNYERKISILESEIENLREERDEILDELNDYKNIADRDLLEELNEKKEKISQLTKKIEEVKEEKNNQILELEKERKNIKDELYILRSENQKFLLEIEQVDKLKTELRIKEESLKEIDILKGENEYLRQKLSSIYSTGQELDLRIQEIKKSPYIHRRLENELKIDNELDYLENIYNDISVYGVKYPKRLLYAFHTAIKSASFSPLTILSGVSGTGKSELPKLYSFFGGFNFLSEAVQPTWDSPESMLGYFNTIENKFDATNILRFLIQTSLSKDESEYGLKESMNLILLDELNLAHIELYFAEFLSKYEIKRGSENVSIDIKLGAGLPPYKIPLDDNLIWVGTMNEDETTKSLSDKVLDRSFLINFPRPKKVKSRKKLSKLNNEEFRFLHRNTWNKWIENEINLPKELIEPYVEVINTINEILIPTNRAVGHRVWQSMEFYIQNHPLVRHNLDNKDKLNKYIKLAFEEQLVQKMMPKLKGIETVGEEGEILQQIENILHENEFSITKDFQNAKNNPYGQFIWNSAEYMREDYE